MIIVIAMDSFKGSLSSMAAARAVQEGILLSGISGLALSFPLADGGEGTVDALASGLGGKRIRIPVTGPLGSAVYAEYCILPDGTAVMEMASAAGLTLIPIDYRNPMITTTYGVGEMIRDAIDRGCRNFIIGIGGSATNDGGTGMLTALGFQFLDADAEPIPRGAQGLAALAEIRRDSAMPELMDCSFRIACDVTNPLCGERGCSTVFAPQKGANPEHILLMDSWLLNFSNLTGVDPDIPGAGAAGGLGYGFLSYLNATLEPGVQIVLEQTGIEASIVRADIVITGEGKLDGQSVMGKAPVGVAALAKKYQKPVIAFCGAIGEGAEICKAHGIDRYYAITPDDMPLAEATKPEIAYENLKNTVARVLHQWGNEKGNTYEED